MPWLDSDGCAVLVGKQIFKFLQLLLVIWRFAVSGQKAALSGNSDCVCCWATRSVNLSVNKLSKASNLQIKSRGSLFEAFKAWNQSLKAQKSGSNVVIIKPGVKRNVKKSLKFAGGIKFENVVLWRPYWSLKALEKYKILVPITVVNLKILNVSAKLKSKW